MLNQGYERVGHNVSATSGRADLAGIARGAGIEAATTARTPEEFEALAEQAMAGDGLSFLVAKVAPGIASVAPRPGDRLEDKYRFVRYVERLEGRPILSGYRARFD